VARRQAAGRASTNRRAAARPSIAAVRAGYEAWLARQPLAARSQETYRQQVGWFLDWLVSGLLP
jgi:hypothetical protein